MSAPTARILVIEDEPAIRAGVVTVLSAEGYQVVEAASVATGRERLAAGPFDLVVADYRLPDATALDLLHWLKDRGQAVPVIVVTAYANVDLAVQAMREGAEHFLTKPVPLATLRVVVARTLAGARDRRHRLARATREPSEGPDPFAGKSPAIQELARRMARVAESDSPVLLMGETGTGKTVLARWLHARSPRAEEPFVDLNCAAIPGELLENELFGHDKGAFTGADSHKAGLIEAAHRGTLFLDEIGDLALEVQPKLLKVLEERRFRRVGSVREQHSDVRLVAATHRDLSARVKEGLFRSDLYFRINIVPLTVPPLRERLEDLPVLVDTLLSDLARDLGRGTMSLEPGAMRLLQRHGWPGNVRELRNVLERAVLFSDGGVLRATDIWFEPGAASAGPELDTSRTLAEVEAWYIARIMEEEDGRVEAAARRLGMPRSTLYQRLRRKAQDG